MIYVLERSTFWYEIVQLPYYETLHNKRLSPT
jgi:hypothetical protein